MPVLHNPSLKCLSVFLNPAERVNIKEHHLTFLASRFSLAVSKEIASKLQKEIMKLQIKQSY